MLCGCHLGEWQETDQTQMDILKERNDAFE